MAFVEFEEIKHLIDSAEKKGGGMTLYFKCPKTGRVVEARGSFPEGMRRGFARTATDSTARALLNQLSALIRRYTGIYIPLGNAFNTSDKPGGGEFVNEADRQAAAISAFESVAEYPGKPVKSARFNFVEEQWVFVE